MSTENRKTSKYIYDLNYDINSELCRLLDMDDCWKELAGEHMGYSPFEINEIEQKSKRYTTSPSHQLLKAWGNLNHRLSELFVLLYHMNHVPAMRCLAPEMDARYLKLLDRLERKNNVNAIKNVDDIGKDKVKEVNNMKIEIKQPVNHLHNGKLNNNLQEDSTKPQPNSETGVLPSASKVNDVNNELIKVAAIPQLNYEELRQATNNWSEQNLLGKGGFGTVYKGEWKHLTVAVKKLSGDDGRFKELIREMCVNQYRHDNILPLYGYSIGGKEACLVYQLMAGGSLEQRLRARTQRALDWRQRYNIAHGVARGLQFLHTMEGTPLIHGDIKPANILLDQCLMPKIGDFGLARKTESKVSKVYGTFAYLPVEYLLSHVVSPSVDVFSFGVLALEMATGLHAFDKNRKVQRLNNLMRVFHDKKYNLELLEDPTLRNTPESNPYLCKQFILIGLDCTEEKREDRPTMLEVYKRLDALQYT